MSLYTRLFGENVYTDYLLESLGLTRDMFCRFRDVFLNETGDKIIVYTRCGGPNRIDYQDMYKEIRGHDMFVTDYDDDFDSTYSYIVFNIPEEYKFQMKSICTGEKPLTVGEMFKKEIAEMDIPNSPAAKRAEKLAKEIEKNMKEQPNGGVIWM